MKKYLKSLAVLLLVVPCLVVFTACGSGAIPNGTYSFKQIVIGDVTIDDMPMPENTSILGDNAEWKAQVAAKLESKGFDTSNEEFINAVVESLNGVGLINFKIKNKKLTFAGPGVDLINALAAAFGGEQIPLSFNYSVDDNGNIIMSLPESSPFHDMIPSGQTEGNETAEGESFKYDKTKKAIVIVTPAHDDIPSISLVFKK